MRQWYNIIDIIPLRIWFLRLSQRSRRFIPPEGIISSIKTGRKCDMKKKNLIKGGAAGLLTLLLTGSDSWSRLFLCSKRPFLPGSR